MDIDYSDWLLYDKRAYAYADGLQMRLEQTRDDGQYGRVWAMTRLMAVQDEGGNTLSVRSGRTTRKRMLLPARPTTRRWGGQDEG